MESFNESKVEETGSSCGKPKRGKMFDILRMQTGAQREEELRKPLLPEEASTKAKGVLLSHLSEKPQHSGIQGRSSDIWQALKEKSGFTEGSSSRKADVGREIQSAQQEDAIQVKNPFVACWRDIREYANKVEKMKISEYHQENMIKAYRNKQWEKVNANYILSNHVNYMIEDFEGKFNKYIIYIGKENQQKAIDITKKLTDEPQNKSLLGQLGDIKKNAEKLANNEYKIESKKFLREKYISDINQQYTDERMNEDYNFVQQYKDYVPKHIVWEAEMNKESAATKRFEIIEDFDRSLLKDMRMAYAAAKCLAGMKMEYARMRVEYYIRTNHPDMVNNQFSLFSEDIEK